MTVPAIVGLSGYARSGKDTVAAVLARYGYARRSFAAPVREALHRLDPVISDDGLTLSAARAGFADPMSPEAWDHVKTRYPEVRRLLQVLGTEVGRGMLGETVWTDLGVRGIRPGDLVVFTDCRFETEAEAVKRLGGEVWRIRRPGAGPVNGHPSETALDGWEFDLVLHNTGPRSCLEQAVRRLAGAR